MDRLRSVFKKPRKDKDRAPSSNSQERISRRDKVRRSQSMPLRNSSDTDDSYHHQRPVYRGHHPLKPSDIQLVLDISAESASKYENHSWPERGAEQREEDDFGGPYCRREDLINKEMLDLFPSPPGSRTRSPSERSARPTRPTTRPPPTGIESIIGSDDLLPPPSEKFAQFLRKKQQQELFDRQRTASAQAFTSDVPVRTAHGRPAVQRSNSSASFSQPTRNAYPNLLQLRARPHAAGHGRSNTHPPYVHPPSITSHPNFSTQSLGADAYLKSGPVAHRAQAVVHYHTPVYAVATVGIEPLRPRKTSNTSARTLDSGSLRTHGRQRDWPARPTGGRVRLESNPAENNSVEMGYFVSSHPYSNSGRVQESTYNDKTTGRY